MTRLCIAAGAPGGAAALRQAPGLPVPTALLRSSLRPGSSTRRRDVAPHACWSTACTR